jgi:hypothetical protein
MKGFNGRSARMVLRVLETKRSGRTGKKKSADEAAGNLPVVQATSPKKADLVNEELVEKAVQFINEKANETIYKGSEAIGAYLLENFFQNDISLASSRNPYKSASYTALCKRTDLVVHPATLSVMVRVAAQEIFFKEEKVKTERLSYTHKAELVKLPDGKEKTKLAQKILEESLTTRQVSEEVKKIKDASTGDEPNAVLLLAAVERCIENPVRLFDHHARSSFISTVDNLKKMKAETRKRLYEKTLSMIEQTREWTKRYEALKNQLEEIEGAKPSDKESSE